MQRQQDGDERVDDDTRLVFSQDLSDGKEDGTDGGDDDDEEEEEDHRRLELGIGHTPDEDQPQDVVDQQEDHHEDHHEEEVDPRAGLPPAPPPPPPARPSTTRQSGRGAGRASARASAASEAKQPGPNSTRSWCFTWNNPPEGYEATIKALFDDPEKDLEYLVYGREVGESGTFHLQGFCQFSDKLPDSELATNGPAQRLFQAHWSKARRIQKARDYCLKDGDYVEHGRFSTRQGRRSDLDEFAAACEAGGMTTKRARREHMEVSARYWRFVEQLIADNKPMPDIPQHEKMYPWQKALEDKLSKQVHPREIIFVVDLAGNTGKSWFALRMALKNPDTVQYMTPGKVTDMAHALVPETTILMMDCPRARIELFQYDFVEQVKNQMVFSAKYESRVKTLPKCHVVVFMNEYPDRTKLSEDRYTVMTVTKALASHDDQTTKHIETWEDYEAFDKEDERQEAARKRAATAHQGASAYAREFNPPGYHGRAY